MQVARRPALKRKRTTQAVVLLPNKRSRPSFARKQGFSAGRKIGPEWKDVTVTGSPTKASGSGTWSTVTLINGCAYGTQPTEHVGRRTTMKNILMRYTIGIATPTSASVLAPLRIIVFYDHDPSGTVPLITDVLSADSINGLNNRSNGDRFDILKDIYVEKEQGFECGVEGAFAYNDHFFIKLDNLECVFNTGSTGGIADIQTGAIFVAYCTTANTVAVGGSRMDFISRVKFTDA